jgi:hypothetical protein
MGALIFQSTIVLYAIIAWLLIKAMRSISKVERLWHQKEAKKAGSDFDFQRSHNLVMDRAYIDKLNKSPDTSDIDTIHFLHNWKMNVAEYIAEFQTSNKPDKKEDKKEDKKKDKPKTYH